MKQKTFNIGEYCVGGTIRVILKHNIIIKVCQYKSKIVVDEITINPLLLTDAFDFLVSITTPYYADQVYQWIVQNKTKVI